MANDTPQPIVVRTGGLSQDEFNSLSPDEQVDIERTAADLVGRYGEALVVRERERYRAEFRIIGYL